MKHMKKLKGIKLPELHALHGKKHLSFFHNESRHCRVERSLFAFGKIIAFESARQDKDTDEKNLI
jgi:hypothetical protein